MWLLHEMNALYEAYIGTKVQAMDRLISLDAVKLQKLPSRHLAAATDFAAFDRAWHSNQATRGEPTRLKK
jgi:hypothetical protein